MRKRRPISIYLDDKTDEILRKEAGRQRLSLTAYCEKVMAKGLMLHETESLLAKVQGVFNPPELDDLRREVLALRYIVESQAKGEVRMPHMIGQFADEHADKEMTKRRAGKAKKESKA